MIFRDGILFFIALPLLILFVWFYFYLEKKSRISILFAQTAVVKNITKGMALKLRHLPFLLRTLAILFCFIALFRPQMGIENTKVETEGVDIVLALDVSGSMRAEDFTLNGKRFNRLHVVKEVVKDFIKKRKEDRIGIVVFGGQAYTQCPLTTDYGVLLQFLDRVEIGMVEDGTAIGDGLATSLNRLRKTESKSKIVILLTDGNNNAGLVDPLNSAELAKAIDVKVYTVGVGGKGQVPFPVNDIFGNKVYQWAVIDIDETILTNIAEKTGGKYFHAENTEGLKEIYQQIDQLEKTKVDTLVYQDYKELFIYFLFIALVFFILELILKNTRFQTIP